GPLLMLFLGAFRSSPLALDATWTLSGFERIMSDSRILGALGTSVIYSGSVVLISLTAATLFAILNVRTNVPLRRAITPVMVALAVIPNMFYVLAWGMLGSRDGSILAAFFKWLGLPDAMESFGTVG